MFSHIMVGSNDIDRSKRFYDAVLGLLGAPEPARNQAPTGHTRLFYRHEGNTFCISEPINGEPATSANGATIGFKCSSPEQVQAFHDAALAHGGRSIETRPACGRARRAPCIWPTCATPTATHTHRLNWRSSCLP